ncbi:MAG TPA: Gldg family protein [Pseudomonadales bacterium]|nr:Gldg family protein [Pseudomonadales bacterium]
MTASKKHTSALLRRFFSGFGLLVVAELLLVGVMLLSVLDQWRIDLTQDHLYTLSQGTRNILQNIKEPIQLKLYYSEAQTRDIPALRNYAQHVKEMLAEYSRVSNGKLKVDIITPEVFSEQEDEAAAAGLQGVPNGNGESIYLGLTGEHKGQSERIVFFNPQRESFLEYDISQMVYRLDQPRPVTAGVISGLPVFRSLDFKTRQPRPSWAIIDQLQQLYDIRRELDTNIEKVDDDLNLLIVIHPNMLPETTLFAIDQFVLRGGKLLVFVDPVAETDESEGNLGEGMADRSSNLEQLFDAWGIDYDPKKVVLDLTYAHSIPVTQYGREMPHVGILGLEGSAMNREQNMIAQIENVNVASAGALAAKPGASTVFIPLLSSSENSQLMDADKYNMVGNHGDLLRQFVPDQHRRHFAALVTGNVKTAFPAGKPAPKPGQPVEVPPKGKPAPVWLKESQSPLQVIVVADTDLLSDRMWVHREDFYGQTQLSPFAANADMVINMVEALSGSSDLMSLRSRGTYQRPFTRVDALEKAASERLREQQDALMTALSEADKKINELNKPAPATGKGAESAPELTQEQKDEVLKFQKEKYRIRKNLRDVQHQLNSDVERLGFQLKMVNIVAVPALLTVLALLLSFVRARRARRT